MPENQLLPTSFGKKTNQLDITLSGNDEQILLTARFDNLGKGASGAAVQNMNIMLGLDEKMGLWKFWKIFSENICKINLFVYNKRISNDQE